MHDRYVRSLLNSLEDRLARLERFQTGPASVDEKVLIRRLNNWMEKFMPTLDETLAKVTEQGDRLDSLLEFVSGLRKQLEEALASAGQLSPEVQAKLDAIFNEAEENRVKIDAALNANAPPPA